MPGSALSLLEAVFVAAMASLLPAVARLRLWPLWVACLWVAQELARATIPFGGFPWGRLAFGQTGSPFTPYAAWGGAPLVTFATALSGGLLALALLRWGSRAVAVAALLGAVAVPLVAMAIPLPTGGPTTTAALVQGGVAEAGLGFLGEREEVLGNHVDATHQLAADVAAGRVARARPRRVAGERQRHRPDPQRRRLGRIEQAASRDRRADPGRRVLDGPGPNNIRNVGIVWDSGHRARRDATSSGIPCRSRSTCRSARSPRLITKVDLVPTDFIAGPRPGVLRVGPARSAM